jgi:hypothetical protein
MKKLKGLRFGRLQAIAPTKVRKDGKIVWECQCDCGETVFVISKNLISGNTKSCGCLKRDLDIARKGDKHPCWRGGKKHQITGHIRMKAGNHPFADGEGYVLEHRLVMEKKIGRLLRPEEVVHHIDGDPSNNAPENLKLFANTGEHTAYHNKSDTLTL